MLDKNGIEIKTGDIVKIENGYFKNSNGYFYVEHAPGDAGWLGKDCSLHKIKKNGQISTAKYSTHFYPLKTFVNDYFKGKEADAYNKEHATIEIIHSIDNTEIKNHFRTEADKYEALAEHFEMYGEPANYKMAKERLDFLKDVIGRM